MLKQIFVSRYLGLINHYCLFFANFMSNFCSWLFVPVLMGTAMFFSLNAQANCSEDDSDQVGFCVNEIEVRAAKIPGHRKPDGTFFKNQYVELIYVNLAGDKPKINHIEDYTMHNPSLFIGTKEFPFSNASQQGSLERAVLEFDNLDDNDFVNPNINLKFTYSISISQFLDDSIRCAVKYNHTYFLFLISWLWDHNYSSCLDSVSVAFRGNSSKKQDIKQSFLNAAQDLIKTENNTIKIKKNDWHSSLDDWVHKQKLRNLETQQNAYVFVNSADQYIKDGANLLDVTVQKILAKNILSNLQDDSKLTMMINAFASENCDNELINKVQFDKRSKRVSSRIKEYIKLICKNGTYDFNQQTKLRPNEFNDANKNLDLEFQASVFCNEYLCEFNLKKEAKYRILYKEKVVEPSSLMREITYSLTLKKCKTGCFVQTGDVHKLIDEFEGFISSHSEDKPWLVVKYDSYGNAYVPTVDEES